VSNKVRTHDARDSAEVELDQSFAGNVARDDRAVKCDVIRVKNDFRVQIKKR
jgi:hypothetical protein